MKKPTCETCVYFCEVLEIKTDGECRKKAPSCFEYDEKYSNNFSPINKTDWCGEHPGFNEWIESQKEKEPSIDFRRVKCPECDSIDIVYGWDVLSQTTCHCNQCGRHFND
jgi:ribosomal protein S27E